MRYWIFCLSVLLFACSPGPLPTEGGVWSQVSAITATDGYEKGVSAPFIGMLDGRVIVAGGCNFPETPASEGGAKRYYADIFALDTSGFSWRKVGMLPQGLAYGACVSVPQGIVCAGGTDSLGRPTDGVYLLTSDGLKTLASLPEPLDNCAGAYWDGRFYVVGAQAFYIYDCTTGLWQPGPLWPGAERRVQSVLVAQAGRVWLFGGYDPAGPEFVTPGGYAFNPEMNDWETVAGPVDSAGGPLLAAGGTGVAWGEDSIVCFGGVNAAVFTEALQRGRTLAAEPENDSLRAAQRTYMEHDPAWYRFNDRVLVYNTTTGRWSVSPESAPQSARAGAAAVALPDEEGVVLFNGELKPGVRTPEVWCWRP